MIHRFTDNITVLYDGDAAGIKALAAAEPDGIMLDDDFRLMFRPGGGCACPLHLSRFERLYGKRADKVRKLYNGMIPAYLYQYFVNKSK